MKTKHIKAPWQVSANGDATYCVLSHTHTESRGLDAKGYECEWSDHTMATARLISAAPDLLHALEMVRDADNDCVRDGLQTIPPIARKTIDDAIAKATGESQ